MSSGGKEDGGDGARGAQLDVRVSGAVLTTLAYEAVIVAVESEPTVLVEIGNVAKVLPSMTVTLPGTGADDLSEARVTLTPPDVAGVVRVTVPVAMRPPSIRLGLTFTLASASATGGVTVRIAVFVVPE